MAILFGSSAWRLPLIMAVSTFVFDGCQSECVHAIKRATVGEELTLMCIINDITCFSRKYSWSMYKNGTNQPLDESSDTYIITQNVTSVLAVGGQEYQCKCMEREDCKQFTIWVTPVVRLTFTKLCVQAGGSVNVTCAAESYPPADKLKFYSLQHPNGTTVVPTHLTTGVDGVIHEILSANSSDGGEYDCVVTVTALVYDRNESMASETVQRNLTVYYDPPYIKHVNNVSTYLDSDSMGKSALLKCEVESTEPGLKICVKWVPVNASMIENVTLRDKDFFFLHLYNITRDDDLVYECWLYFELCPDQPMDKKIAVIHETVLSTVCSSTITETSTPSCKGLTPKNEGNTSHVIVCSVLSGILLLLLIILLLVVIVFIVVFSIILWKKRQVLGTHTDGGVGGEIALTNLRASPMENRYHVIPAVGNNISPEENGGGVQYEETGSSPSTRAVIFSNILPHPIKETASLTAQSQSLPSAMLASLSAHAGTVPPSLPEDNVGSASPPVQDTTPPPSLVPKHDTGSTLTGSSPAQDTIPSLSPEDDIDTGFTGSVSVQDTVPPLSLEDDIDTGFPLVPAQDTVPPLSLEDDIDTGFPLVPAQDTVPPLSLEDDIDTGFPLTGSVPAQDTVPPLSLEDDIDTGFPLTGSVPAQDTVPLSPKDNIDTGFPLTPEEDTTSRRASSSKSKKPSTDKKPLLAEPSTPQTESAEIHYRADDLDTVDAYMNA